MGKSVREYPDQHKPLPRQVADQLDRLRGSRDKHKALAFEIMQSDGGGMYSADLVVFAVLQRSLALIDGLIALVEQRNSTCANALVRLQIDSILRIYALRLTEKHWEVAKCMLDGKPINKIKDRKGQELTDAYLCKKAGEQFPWIESAYRTCSGFIHLSKPHMLSWMSGYDADRGKLGIQIGEACEWSEHAMNETVTLFETATDTLLEVCNWWK